MEPGRLRCAVHGRLTHGFLISHRVDRLLDRALSERVGARALQSNLSTFILWFPQVINSLIKTLSFQSFSFPRRRVESTHLLVTLSSHLYYLPI